MESLIELQGMLAYCESSTSEPHRSAPSTPHRSVIISAMEGIEPKSETVDNEHQQSGWPELKQDGNQLQFHVLVQSSFVF